MKLRKNQVHFNFHPVLEEGRGERSRSNFGGGRRG